MSQASHEFRGSVDFNQNELRNATFQNLITPPIGPRQGQIYFNSRLDLKSPFYWNSEEWIPFGLKPIHKRYSDEVSMLAGQSLQIKYYIYYRSDEDIYYEYLGTTTGVFLTDYNPIGGAGLVTASNGLTKVGNDIRLGDSSALASSLRTVKFTPSSGDGYNGIFEISGLYRGYSAYEYSAGNFSETYFDLGHDIFSNTPKLYIDFYRGNFNSLIEQEITSFRASQTISVQRNHTGVNTYRFGQLYTSSINSGVSVGMEVQGDFGGVITGMGIGINNGTSADITISDGRNFRGAEYAGDYEANFVPRSLVTQQYVTSEIIANAYIHPTFTPFIIDTTGPQIIDEITTTSEGHVSGITLRNLTLADLGFTGDNNANNYIHPAYTPQNPTLTGALVLASIQTDAIGSVQSITTRTLTPANIGAININQLGVANGVATLDGSGTLTESQLPASILGGVKYIDNWDASLNSPTLPDPTTVKGNYYVVTVGAVVTGPQYDGGSIDFNPKDWVISNGTVWKKVDNTDSVSSVFGRQGNIIALAGDYAGFYVRHDVNTQGLSGINQENARTNIDAEKTIIGGATTITQLDLTADRVLISNGLGKVAVSAVTALELSYLDGVTSGIQGQLDAKLEGNEIITLTGDVTGSGATSIATTISNDAVTTTKILNSNVTYAKIQNVSANRILGQTATTGIVKELTAAEVRTIINVADGANNYVHPTKAWVDKTTLSGATVISNLTIDSLGHPTNWTTRELTPADIGAASALSINGTVNRLAKFTASGTVGDSILVDDTNGVYNTGKGNSTFFGFRAGLNDDGTNNENTFVGYQAGLSNTTGSLNSFFGFGAGQFNTTGTNNSFFGFGAGLFNTTGGSNSVFGRSAGLFNTTGINNLFFGYQAGIYTSSGANLTVANNSVFLGYDTRANASGETNQIVIGYQAEGQGSNTTTIGNSSTTLTRLYGELRVGTINNLATPATEFLVKDALGIIHHRTATEVLSDIGAATSSQINIGTGQVAFGNGAGTIGGDDGLTWDNVSKALNINSSGGYILDVLSPTPALNGVIARFRASGSLYNGIVITGDTNAGWLGNSPIFASEGFYFQNNINAIRIVANGGEAIRINSLRNVGINTSSPTNTIDVNGTARIRTINNLGTSATVVLTKSATGVISERTVGEILGDIGGIGEAPSDGQQYARQNSSWQPVTIPTGSVPVTESFTYSSSNIFNLSNSNVTVVYVTLNGQVLREGGLYDYTISGSQLTVTTPINSGGEISILYYTELPNLTTVGRNIDGGSPTSTYLPIQNVNGGTP